jgi:hypothetical protein
MCGKWFLLAGQHDAYRSAEAPQYDDLCAAAVFPMALHFVSSLGTVHLSAGTGLGDENDDIVRYVQRCVVRYAFPAVMDDIDYAVQRGNILRTLTQSMYIFDRSNMNLVCLNCRDVEKKKKKPLKRKFVCRHDS